MERTPLVHMEKTGKIIRRSIHTLLKDFQYMSTIPSVLLLPFSTSILLLQPLYLSIQNNPTPSKPRFFGTSNLYQMVCSYVLTLPFALSFLVMAKSCIIHSLTMNRKRPTLFSTPTFQSIYVPLAKTNLCNTASIITIGTTAFAVLRLASDFTERFFGLSSKNPFLMLVIGLVFYMLLANTMVITNLALVITGMDCLCNNSIFSHKSYKAVIRKARLLRKRTKSMALLLALPSNLGLLGIQSLFRYRVVRACNDHDHLSWRSSSSKVVSIVFEGVVIAYMFSVLIVLDTISSCLFIKSCEQSNSDTTIEEEQA